MTACRFTGINRTTCLLCRFFTIVLEFISGTVALHSVFKQFVPAHLANEQALPVKQILF